MLEPTLDSYIKGPLVDGDGNEVIVRSLEYLGSDTRERYIQGAGFSAKFSEPLFSPSSFDLFFWYWQFFKALSICSSIAASSLENLSRLTDPLKVAMIVRSDIDHIAVVNESGVVELILCDDAISYESLSPLQLVEYAFENGTLVLFLFFIQNIH